MVVRKDDTDTEEEEEKYCFSSLATRNNLSMYHSKNQVGAKANGKLRTEKSYVRARSFLDCAGCAK